VTETVLAPAVEALLRSADESGGLTVEAYAVNSDVDERALSEALRMRMLQAVSSAWSSVDRFELTRKGRIALGLPVKPTLFERLKARFAA